MVVAADLVVYGSANMQETDSGTQGGAIDAAIKMAFTDIAATDATTIISDNAGDTTQTVTITGRNSEGSIVSEAIGLNGTSRATGSTSFERILKIVMDATASGTVTITRDNTPTFTAIATLEAGLTQVRRPFYDVSADESGGSSRDFYEKVFVKNNNSTTALLAATIAETDPSGNVTFALEDAVTDTGTSTNRVTAPTASEIGTSGFDSADKTLAAETDAATADLAASTAIGVWVKLTLAAGTAAANTTYTITASGSSV